MSIQTYSDKKINRPLKLLLIILGVAMTGANLLAKSYYGVIVGLFLLYLSTFEKKVLIVQEGIAIHVKALWMKHDQLLDFSNITHIRVESMGDRTVLHFMQTHLARRVLVDPHEVGRIVAWAKEKNKEIHVDRIGY